MIRSFNIGTSYKPHSMIKRLLVHPKDKVAKEDICECVYQIGCANCSSVYIGETGRKFGTRLEEHHKDVTTNTPLGVSTRSNRTESVGELHKSAITDHMVDNNHIPDWENARVLDRESFVLDRQIRESIWIRKSSTNMNRDEGSYKLPHVYDKLLHSTRPKGAKGGATNR